MTYKVNELVLTQEQLKRFRVNYGSPEADERHKQRVAIFNAILKQQIANGILGPRSVK